MSKDPKNYEHLIGKVKGLSERQLRAHLELYGGYVKKLNEIEQRLGTVDRAASNYSFGDYSELKRREPVAFNGAFLHELYFDALGAGGEEAPETFKKAATAAFGSYDRWVLDVKAMAASAHGWALTTWSAPDSRLRNVLVQSEHHTGLFVDQKVLLAIDLWEHAYFADYLTKKADYVEAILSSQKWKVIDQRLASVPPA